MKHIMLVVIVLALINSAVAQNVLNQRNISSPDLMYDQNSYLTIGLLSMTLKYPTKLQLSDFTQKGLMIGNKKNSKNIDEINFSDYLIFSINIGSENAFGLSVAENFLDYTDEGITTRDTVKQYTGFVNLVSYNLNAELTNTIPVINRKIIGGVGITFFNIGGNFTYMTGGRYNKQIIGALDIVPFYLQFYGKLSLKNATIGAGLLLNPYNFVEYRFGPASFMGDYSGLKLSSSMYNKLMARFFINFR